MPWEVGADNSSLSEESAQVTLSIFLGTKTGYLFRLFYGFPQSPQENSGTLPN
jgi:hypothetical protein